METVYPKYLDAGVRVTTVCVSSLYIVVGMEVPKTQCTAPNKTQDLVHASSLSSNHAY